MEVVYQKDIDRPKPGVSKPAEIEPVAPEPPPEPKTPEQIAEETARVYKAMGWPEPPKKDDAPPEPPVEPPVVPAAVAPPEPPPVAPAVTPPADEPPVTETTDQIIERTARQVATEIESRRPTPTPAEPPPQPAQAPTGMSVDDAEDLRVLRWLEANNPAYRGKSQEFVDYLTKLEGYKAKWATDNKGEAFDDDAAEHESWYAANQPDIDPRQLERSRIEMLADERAEEKMRPIKTEMAQARQEQRLKEAMPEIIRGVERGIIRLVEAAAPDLAELMGEKGKRSLGKEVEAKMEEADPIAHTIIETTSRLMAPLVAELEKNVVNGAEYKLQPEKNPVHATIDRYVRQAERDMASAPADSRVFPDGKKFLSARDYDTRKRELERSNGSATDRAQRLEDFEATYRSFTVDEIQEIIVDDYAKNARELIASADKVAKKKYVKQNGAPAPEPAPQPTPAPIPPKDGNKPRSPATVSSADQMTNRNSPQPGSQTFGEQASKQYFK